MLLNPQNSTNPAFWGKELLYVSKGVVLGGLKVEIPNEVDFFKEFFKGFELNAREYFTHK